MHLPYLITYYASQCTKLASRDRLLPVLKGLCKRAWDHNPTQSLCVYAHFEEIYRSILRVGDWEFFDLAAKQTYGHLPTQFLTWARDELISGRIAFQDIGEG